ncbi:MAG: OmpA family protein [Cytophagales bacterium]
MIKNLFTISVLGMLVITSCVSKKKYKDAVSAKEQLTEQNKLLDKAVKKCDKDMVAASARIKSLEEQLEFLKKNNQELISNVGNMTVLTKKGAENLEKSLEAIKEKDTQIKTLQDALTKKDSITIALVTSIKSSLGNMDDKDIEVNVDKGVVFVSIADKMLFQSGSYKVSPQAKNVLNKVAIVAKSKPDFEIMVESHTDNVPVKNAEGVTDNWDLSVLRSTSIVRVLTDDLGIAPERIIAAGRSQFVPLVTNDSPEGKARNRRTRIILLPKIDQFYKMVEEGMKQAQEK